MIKSLETYCVAALSALFKDVQMAYPKMSSLDRDKLRLLSLCKTRGLSSLMIDLPNLDNMLLAGLETGSLMLDGPLSSAVSKRIRVPRLFVGLWLHVFDKKGILRVDPDINAIYFLRQLINLLKRIKHKCSPARMNNAVKEYYDVEESLRHPTLLWADDEFDEFDRLSDLHFSDGLKDDHGCEVGSSWAFPTARIRILCNRLQNICDSVAQAIGNYDPYDFTSEVGKASSRRRFLSHGRGAVSDQPRYGNRYHFHSWSDRLNRVFPYEAFGTHRIDDSHSSCRDRPSLPSKLLAVPKTLAKPRLIASEPASHQWCQQITLRWLVSRITHTDLGKFIDLSNQELSKTMVIRASRTKEMATVDLSSASDRLSCWAIERFLRVNPTLLDALMAHRTPFIKDGVTNRDQIFLRKFASQGTGVTFPIQTIFFLCCVLAACGKNSLGLSRNLRGHVRVYGDDIILPVSGYEDLCSLLEFLELKVNKEKSFVHGEFRESCGMDSYKGHDVTPLKPTELSPRGPKSVQSLVDFSKNAHLRGLWNLSAWAELTVKEVTYGRLPIIGPDLGVPGWVSFLGSKVDHLKKRWNSKLQRNEVLCLSFNAVDKRIAPEDESGIFQFFAENPSQDQKWSSGVSQKPRLVMRPRWVDVSELHVAVPPIFGEGLTYFLSH